MQVSTSSWHYRFIANRVHRYYMIPTNLCPYMRLLLWQTICEISKRAVQAICILFGAICLLSPLALLVHSYGVEFIPASWLTPKSPNDLTTFQLVCGIGIIVYIIAGIVLAAMGIGEGVERYRQTDFARARRIAKSAAVNLPPKQPSIFAAWLKGLHDKTCTSLEFVE